VTRVDEPVDYRYLLANERTFLAYVRTALSLQVAGLGVLQFLTHGHDAVRYTLGVLLVLAGSYAGLAGYLRFRTNERAIRAGSEMQTARATSIVTAAVVVVPLAAALAIAVSSAA
jgi:putative membrane protein